MNKEDNNEKNCKESKIKFAICMGTFVTITAVDLIRDELSTQSTLLALLYFLLDTIEKYKKTKKKSLLFLVTIYLFFLLYMIYDYISGLF